MTPPKVCQRPAHASPGTCQKTFIILMQLWIQTCKLPEPEICIFGAHYNLKEK